MQALLSLGDEIASSLALRGSGGSRGGGGRQQQKAFRRVVAVLQLHLGALLQGRRAAAADGLDTICPHDPYHPSP